jgi:hypothetical protein
MTPYALKKFNQDGFEIAVGYTGKDFWLTQKQIAELLGLTVPTVNEQIGNYKNSPVAQEATIRKFRIVQSEGKREVEREIEHYNLDVVMHVAFRAQPNGENADRVKAFRTWATSIIRRYLTGELRSADRHVYQNVRDCIALASDYRPNSDLCQDYFATIQNKLLYAATDHTAPELICSRADSTAPNMGLTHWQHENIRKDDVVIGKNYLTDVELRRLNRLNEALLIVADEFQERVSEGEQITMANWVESVDRQIITLRMNTLVGKGTVSRKDAEVYATREY